MFPSSSASVLIPSGRLANEPVIQNDVTVTFTYLLTNSGVLTIDAGSALDLSGASINNAGGVIDAFGGDIVCPTAPSSPAGNWIPRMAAFRDRERLRRHAVRLEPGGADPRGRLSGAGQLRHIY